MGMQSLNLLTHLPDTTHRRLDFDPLKRLDTSKF